MEQVPEHRAMFGVDVVGSARNPGHHLNAIREAVDQMVPEAMRRSDIPQCDVLTYEPTGDGALITLPAGRLGALLDAAQHLDALASAHNRWRKPDVRFRIAVDVGPVGDRPGYYAARIAHSRLLDAPAFKALFIRCREEDDEDSVNSALIVSENALRVAFSGDHTQLVRHGEFAPIPLEHKEITDTAWVRVPGVDTRALGSFVEAQPVTTSEPRQTVTNQAYGAINGIQAGTINGAITFGQGPR